MAWVVRDREGDRWYWSTIRNDQIGLNGMIHLSCDAADLLVKLECSANRNSIDPVLVAALQEINIYDGS
jgi:hypothetical protein